jgi:hypothetical protein
VAGSKTLIKRKVPRNVAGSGNFDKKKDFLEFFSQPNSLETKTVPQRILLLRDPIFFFIITPIEAYLTSPKLLEYFFHS